MSKPIYQTVIVGGGFTGLFTALHLAHKHYPRSIILIEPNDRFCFKPLLYEYVSGQMDALQVLPRYQELLRGSGVISVKDSVKGIDLDEQEIKLVSGDIYNYSHLVLALGSVTNYFGIKGAKEYALPFWSEANAIAIEGHIRDCLQQAIEIPDSSQRQVLLTFVVVGGGASGVEMAATLADLLPSWYAKLGGDAQEVRVILINHGHQILEGDINSHLRQVAEKQLQKRVIKVEMLMEAAATAVGPKEVEYESHGKTETINAATTIWTTGSSVHPLIKDLSIPKEHRDHQGRPLVTPTLQLLDFPEVLAGGDCVAVKDSPLPATAQVAYQQGYAIAKNLIALAFGQPLQPAKVNIRGTLLKLGLESAAANIYNKLEIDDQIGHLIRQGTYLELLPSPIHDFEATAEWLKEGVFRQHISAKTSKKTKMAEMEILVGLTMSLIVGRKLLKLLKSR